MGLFDPSINMGQAGLFSDPKQLGLLSLGLRLMSTPGSFGQAAGAAGLGAINDMQQAEEANSQREARGVRMAHDTLSLKRAREQMDEERRTRDYLTRAFTPTSPVNANDASGIVGPRPAALQAVGQVPGFQFGDAIRAGVPLSAAAQMAELLKKQRPELKAFKPGEVYGYQTEDGGFKQIGAVPDKADRGTSDMQEFAFAMARGEVPPGVTFTDWMRANKRAGATSVTVQRDNLGLSPKDRFEMEGKLAGDYQQLVKSDNAAIQAAGKIKIALGQPGALKDQAAIYNFAKMLDELGAVREADYAAIANTTGLVDRLRGYVQRIQTGEQLTPTQRQEMGALATAFEGAAKARIAKAQADSSRQAQRYNLDPRGVFGQVSEPIDFFSLPGGK